MVYPWEAVGVGYIMKPLSYPHILKLGHADLF